MKGWVWLMLVRMGMAGGVRAADRTIAVAGTPLADMASAMPVPPPPSPRATR